VTGPPPKTGPRVNREIATSTVRLIDESGENIGVVSIEEGLSRAEAAGLDLVEISPNTDPPVCKILDYGKFKYIAQKKKAEARKRQKITEIKEIKIRPGIDEADYRVKMRNIHKFLTDGDKVKVTLRFRGREMLHQDLGRKMLDRVLKDIEDLGKAEQFPKMEGRQMVMICSPK
jgi:translation initiation factor IF-3